MIEFCSRKRMALAIIVLVSLSVVTLIVEGVWSNNHNLADLKDNTGSNESCTSGEPKIVNDCQPCSRYELKMKQPFCLATGYREVILCKDGVHITRSCRVDPWIEERKFWILEAITCLVGVGSYGFVKYRQSQLDRMLMDKVNRQIAA